MGALAGGSEGCLVHHDNDRWSVGRAPRAVGKSIHGMEFKCAHSHEHFTRETYVYSSTSCCHSARWKPWQARFTQHEPISLFLGGALRRNDQTYALLKVKLWIK